jgi:hypothetical protein
MTSDTHQVSRMNGLEAMAGGLVAVIKEEVETLLRRRSRRGLLGKHCEREPVGRWSARQAEELDLDKTHSAAGRSGVQSRSSTSG